MLGFLFVAAFFIFIFSALLEGRGGCVTFLFILFAIFIFLINPFIGLPVTALIVLVVRGFFKD